MTAQNMQYVKVVGEPLQSLMFAYLAEKEDTRLAIVNYLSTLKHAETFTVSITGRVTGIRFLVEDEYAKGRDRYREVPQGWRRPNKYGYSAPFANSIYFDSFWDLPTFPILGRQLEPYFPNEIHYFGEDGKPYSSTTTDLYFQTRIWKNFRDEIFLYVPNIPKLVEDHQRMNAEFNKGKSLQIEQSTLDWEMSDCLQPIIEEEFAFMCAENNLHFARIRLEEANDD